MSEEDLRRHLLGHALEALITRHDGQLSERAIAERAIVYADTVIELLRDTTREPAATLLPEEIERLRNRPK